MPFITKGYDGGLMVAEYVNGGEVKPIKFFEQNEFEPPAIVRHRAEQYLKKLRQEQNPYA